MDALRQDIHIPKGVYCLLVLGLVRNLPDFRKPKQTLINAFYYVCKPITRLCGAKVVNYFELSKGNCFFRVILFSEHSRRELQLGLRGRGSRGVRL